MKKHLGIVALAMIAVVPLSAQTATQFDSSGPFGFRMGMTLEQIRRIGTVSASPDGSVDVYSIKTAPNPRGDFEFYILIITPKQGLCKINAVGTNVSSGSDGTSLVSTYENLRDAITAKYGKGEEYNFLHAGSIWSNNEDFMMGLKLKERTLATVWGVDNTPLQDANHVASISVEGNASNSNSGYVTLMYEFANWHDCKAEMTAAANSVF